MNGSTQNVMSAPEIKVIVNRDTILGNLAKWAIRQSPYHRPENLEIALDKMAEAWLMVIPDAGDGYANFTYEQIIEFVKISIEKIPEIQVWNERKNGNKSEYKFVSRHSNEEENPDDDFIDLNALARNIANEVMFENFDSHSIPHILNGIAKRR